MVKDKKKKILQLLKSAANSLLLTFSEKDSVSFSGSWFSATTGEEGEQAAQSIWFVTRFSVKRISTAENETKVSILVPNLTESTGLKTTLMLMVLYRETF